MIWIIAGNAGSLIITVTTVQNSLPLWGINHIKSLVIRLIVSLGVFIALLSLLLFRRQNKKLDKASIVYNRYCTKLAKKQLFIGTSEEAKDFSERTLARFPDQAEKIADITNLYIKIR